MEVLIWRCTILRSIHWYNEDFRKSAILMPGVNFFLNLGEFQIETVIIKVVDNNWNYNLSDTKYL